MKKFFGTARRPSYSSVNSYTRDCGSWMLMHFERIHLSRSEENDVMNVHLFGSTVLRISETLDLRNHHEIVRTRERPLGQILQCVVRCAQRQFHHYRQIEP